MLELTLAFQLWSNTSHLASHTSGVARSSVGGRVYTVEVQAGGGVVEKSTYYYFYCDYFLETVPAHDLFC